jgi:sucrose-phosphate synthase
VSTVHIAFLNPQGNFDPGDSYWTEHPDFGGQLVYVKHVALAVGAAGYQVDVLTRRIVDADWPEFAAQFDAYSGAPNVRIVRLPAGPDKFLPKELLWPHLVRDWVPNILDFYRDEGSLPDIFTAHYGDGGLCGVLIKEKTRISFLFTAHSLGAQKMGKLGVSPENLTQMNARFHFGRRLMAERLSMSHSAINVTSTRMERFEQYGHYAYREAVDVHDGNRFAVIPPGVNLSIFGADARYEQETAVHRYIQERLVRDITEGRRQLPAVVASSRLDPKKNHLGLVQAFAKSSSLQGQANLVLITGALDDPLHDDASAGPIEQQVLTQIREVIAAHGLWGKVSAFSLQGQRALAAAYRFLARQGSVFALTAHYEPFGLAPLEAAAAGLPVVVTRNGGPSESFCEDDEEYGVLVDPADSDDIAHGLERLLGDAQAWRQFARGGQQRVLAHYTWERTAEGYLALMKQIITSPEAHRLGNPLPISPYFRPPRLEEDIPIAVLKHLYCQ